MKKMVEIKYDGLCKLGMVDVSEFIASGENATPTSRVLDGSQDHGYAEEWQEEGTICGKSCRAIYLFDAEEVDQDAENYPWDPDHIARIILDDDEEWKN